MSLHRFGAQALIIIIMIAYFQHFTTFISYIKCLFLTVDLNSVKVLQVFFTELLSSPSTNNSVAMDLIKRNGTNYGPFPARDIMYCNVLAWPQQPVQTSRDWAGWQRERERGGGCDWEGPSVLAITSLAIMVQCCGEEEEHTERCIGRVSLWAVQGHSLSLGLPLSIFSCLSAPPHLLSFLFSSCSLTTLCACSVSPLSLHCVSLK